MILFSLWHLNKFTKPWIIYFILLRCVNNVTENHHQKQPSEKKGLDLLNYQFVGFFTVLLLSVQWAEHAVNIKKLRSKCYKCFYKITPCGLLFNKHVSLCPKAIAKSVAGWGCWFGGSGKIRQQHFYNVCVHKYIRTHRE